MRILISGAAGFIGSSLADELLWQGHEVWGIDDLSTGRRDNLPDDFPLVVGDIRDPEAIAGVGIGPWDVIYHCAASYKDRGDWERDASVNVLGTINVVREALRSKARLVYFQTSLCYGPNPPAPVPADAPLDPRGSYAVSKTAGESYIRESGADWVSLRLANVYGPRNLSGPVPVFYQRLAAGKPCTVVDARRDFILVDDLVRLAIRVATDGRGIYHAASGRDRSILDIYHAVAGAMRLDADEPAITPRAADDVATILLDPTETLLEFGWVANAPLVAGIRAAVDWYRTHPVTETFTHLSTKG